MDDTLRLEYSCTPAEAKEAEELLLRTRIGGGSKWLTTLILLTAMAAMLLSFYHKIEPAHRPCMFALLAVITVIVLLVQRFCKRRAKETSETPAIVEIASQGIRIAGDSGWSFMSWSAFGKLVESETLFVLPDRPGCTLFIFPKRAFPNQESCDWFREVAAATRSWDASPDPAESLPASQLPQNGSQSITIEYRLRLRDYFTRALASWRMRLAMIFTGVFVTVIFAAASINPTPDAVLTTKEIFFFVLPAMLAALGIVVFLVFSFGAWLKDRRHVLRQTVTLSEQGISLTCADGHTNANWDSRVRYKETPWSFLIWWTDTHAWIQIPYSAFSTIDGRSKCRGILAQHAAQSTWYFG